MSIVPGATGFVASAAGAPLSQTKGSETERTARDGATTDRTTDQARKAEQSAGIGQTEADQETSERDADGRRLWEAPPKAKGDSEEEATSTRRPADPRGETGTKLDLTG